MVAFVVVVMVLQLIWLVAASLSPFLLPLSLPQRPLWHPFSSLFCLRLLQAFPVYPSNYYYSQPPPICASVHRLSRSHTRRSYSVLALPTVLASQPVLDVYQTPSYPVLHL